MGKYTNGKWCVKCGTSLDIVSNIINYINDAFCLADIVFGEQDNPADGAKTATSPNTSNPSSTFLTSAAHAPSTDNIMWNDRLMEKAENFFVLDECEEEKAGTHRAQRRGVASIKTRCKWTEEEEEEIDALFVKCIKKKKHPSAYGCKEAMKKSRDKNGLIHKRSLSALKNKVIRLIDRLLK